MVDQECKDRMYLRKFGEREVDFIEPCFDMNQKEYIRREDIDAEKFKVLRMRAKVARSIQPDAIRTDKETMKKLMVKHSSSPGYSRKNNKSQTRSLLGGQK